MRYKVKACVKVHKPKFKYYECTVVNEKKQNDLVQNCKAKAMSKNEVDQNANEEKQISRS